MTVLRKVDWPLLMILLIAAVVRYWGISFGFPYTMGRPDEQHTVELAIDCLRYVFNPHWFGYPTFYMYINAIIYSIYYQIGFLLGCFSSVTDFISGHGIFNLYMIDRCLSAFLGIATVFITYKITFYMTNRKTGIIASGFLALTYIHVRNSHYDTTDIPVTFFIMCSTLFLLNTNVMTTLRNYLISGIFAGLAAGTKYIGILMILPAFLSILFENLDRQSANIKVMLDPRLLTFGTVTIIVFLLSTPYALFDYSEFYRDVTNQWGMINCVPRGLFGHGWWYHLKFSLFYGFGWPLLFASMAGIFIAFRNNLRKASVFMAFPVAYYALVLKGGMVYVRYTVPLLPFLCATAAIFTVFLGELLGKYLPGRCINLVYVLAPLMILPSALNTVKFDNLFLGGTIGYWPQNGWKKISAGPPHCHRSACRMEMSSSTPGSGR